MDVKARGWERPALRRGGGAARDVKAGGTRGREGGSVYLLPIATLDKRDRRSTDDPRI